MQEEALSEDVESSWPPNKDQTRNLAASNIVMKFPGVLSDNEFRLHLDERSAGLGSGQFAAVAGGELLLTTQSLVRRSSISERAAEVSNVVFVSYRNLKLLLPQSSADLEDAPVSSPSSVLSASVGFHLGSNPSRDNLVEKDIQLGDPVIIRLQHSSGHLGRPMHCLAWSQHHQEWLNDVCLTIESNGTHTSCSCTTLSRYVLAPGEGRSAQGRLREDLQRISDNYYLQESPETRVTEDVTRNEYSGLTFVLVVVVSSSVLVVTVLALVLIVLYCRRIKVRFENESKFLKGYNCLLL